MLFLLFVTGTAVLNAMQHDRKLNSGGTRPMRMKPLWLALAALGSLALVTGCRSDGPSAPDEREEEVPTRPLNGTVLLPAGALIAEPDLEFRSFAGAAAIAGGAFAAEAVAGTGHQFVAAFARNGGAPVLLGYLAPEAGAIELSTQSTALALVMFNPMLLAMPSSERARMALAVRQHPRFVELTSLIDASLRSAPDAALDEVVNPATYQVAMEIGISALQSFGAQGLGLAVPSGSPPTIRNAPGDEITAVNPRLVFYCAGLSDGATARNPPDQITVIWPKDRVVEARLGWPPLVLAEPEETSIGVGRGQYAVRFESGTRITLDRIDVPTRSPETCAYLANTLKAVFFALDWIIGWDPAVGGRVLFSTDGLARFQVTVRDLWDIGASFALGDPAGAFVGLIQFLSMNTQALGLYLTQEGFKLASSEFMNRIAGIALKAAKVYQFIGAANEQIPFVYDWVTAPRIVDYCFTKDGAAFSECGSNAPPAAMFTVSPLAGDISTVFTFDASATTDDMDAAAEVEVRWDFDGDGSWDTPWSVNKGATRTYGARDAYTVFLEARDRSQSSSIARTIVNVSGGYASGKHILIFRDVLPWQNVQIEELLIGHGFLPGPGLNQFEVLPSTQMQSRPLVPGESFVIISNSQNQTFYDRYALNNVRFAQFVAAGGTIFWEACDLGWYNNTPNVAGGDLRRAGVVIPGNVGTRAQFDAFNYVVDEALPLVQGIPPVVQHNYASHETFTNLPAGTTIYMANQAGEPTLIEYKYGSGWVLATGQPIEHGYYYGADLGLLLPRVVAYVLGVESADVSSATAVRTVVRPRTPSSLRQIPPRTNPGRE